MAKEKSDGLNLEKTEASGYHEEYTDVSMVPQKKKWRQLLCRHEYQSGILYPAELPRFEAISGQTVTTVCVKCGEVKDSVFIRYD